MLTDIATRSSARVFVMMLRGAPQSFPIVAYWRCEPPIQRHCSPAPVFAPYGAMVPKCGEKALASQGATPKIYSQGASSTTACRR